jgi:D-tyrosyl-tRNA(Tyr) deacylase
MRACVQRVSAASVSVGGAIVGQIGRGVLVLLGVATGDSEADASWLADKIAGLRIFDDEAGKMNLSIKEVGGAVLVVSQFTLLGDCRHGRRPSFVDAAPPELAERLYEAFVEGVRTRQIEVATGQFRRQMQVQLINDGPVTLLVESNASQRS